MNHILDFKDSAKLRDRHEIKSKSLLKTKVKAWITDTGEVLFETHNIITIAGGAFLARAMFDLPSNTEITPSYNNALNLDNSVNTSSPSSSNKVYLFCVGTDGCGRENSQVYAEKYASWINPNNGLVPFQYVPVGSDLNVHERAIYFGRKTGTDFISYYFKRFDSDPMMIQQLTDGTPIDSNIYGLDSSLDAETIVTMQMSITKSDCRDYFINTTGINDARINTISLCAGWAKEVDGNKYYQDIRPLTRLNFPNEVLIDTQKSITISYSVYF